VRPYTDDVGEGARDAEPILSKHEVDEHIGLIDRSPRRGPSIEKTCLFNDRHIVISHMSSKTILCSRGVKHLPTELGTFTPSLSHPYMGLNLTACTRTPPLDESSTNQMPVPPRSVNDRDASFF
jgi:hypothetical protein